MHRESQLSTSSQEQRDVEVKKGVKTQFKETKASAGVVCIFCNT